MEPKDIQIQEDHKIELENQDNILKAHSQLENQDLTTGDVYVTHKNLQEIVDLINQQAGNKELKESLNAHKETIQSQQQAIESLQLEFNKQLESKNQKIEELEKEVKELLLQQPTDSNSTIGNTLIELRQQVHNLHVESTQKEEKYQNLKDEIQTKDNDLQTQITNINKRFDTFTDEFNVDILTNEILKNPIKAKEVVIEILKNPHHFPPFQLNPLVDSNADVFAQVRETLNTSREILRLLSTLDYINKHFQDDATQLRALIQKALSDLLAKRDEALNNLEKVTKALDIELQNMKYMLDIIQKEHTQYKLLKDEVAWFHSEAFTSYSICKDYVDFCINIRNDNISIRDDITLQLKDIEALKEETRGFKDRSEFLYTSLVNMNYDGLVAKVNHLEYMINTMAEKKRDEIIKAIDTLGKFLLGSLKDAFLDYKRFLESQFINSKVELKKLCDEIIEKIDDTKLEALDKINILTLSSLGALQSAKQLSLDLIRYNTDECIEELTQVKSDYLMEIQDLRVDSINTIHEHFTVGGRGLMVELSRINNELNALKHNSFMPEFNYVIQKITESQVFKTPDDNKFRNYFILIKGGSGFDNNANKHGEPSSFGGYKSVEGGVGSGNGRGSDGESAFFAIALNPNTEINVTIGNGQRKGFCEISYAIANETNKANIEEAVVEE